MNFNDAHFSLNRAECLVEVGSESTSTGRITSETAHSDIQRGITTFEYLKRNSSDFAKTIKGHSPRFSLIVDDGMVTVDVAYLSNREIIFVGDSPTSY